MKLNTLDWIAYVLIIIGGINWGLVGAISWNLVDAVLGSFAWLTRLIYILVGLSAIYMIFVYRKL